MDFEIVSEIENVQTFAAGLGVRDRKRLPQTVKRALFSEPQTA